MAAYTTLAEAQAAYLANADYADGAGDATKAATFRTACRSLLVLMPQTTGQGGSTLTMSMPQIAAELKTVDAWVAAQPESSSRRTSWTRARVIP